MSPDKLVNKNKFVRWDSESIAIELTGDSFINDLVVAVGYEYMV